MQDRAHGTGPKLQALAAGAGAGLAAGALDSAWTAARGPWLAGFPVVACGVMALTGGLVGVAALGGWRLVGGLWRGVGGGKIAAGWWVAAAWASAALGGLLLLAGLAVFSAETPPARLRAFAWASAGAGLAALVVLRGVGELLARRPRLAGPAAGVLGVAGLAAAGWVGAAAEEVDTRFVWVGLAYAAALAWLAATRRPRRALAVVAAAAVIAAGGLAVLATQPAVRLVAARYSPATDRVARAIARLADVDGDGFSPLSGEGDCAPLDAEAHPFAVDRPGDGVDQDCHAGDLDPATLPPAVDRPAEAPRAKRRPNVVFVSVETLRADHMGFLGYARATTPRLDAWVEAGAVVFERAYTVAPVTDRVLPAWLGAMYPSTFVEAQDYATHVMGAARELLPERLQAAGYRTIVLQSYHLFDDHGLAQGIDELEILGRQSTQDARWTTNRALRRVREHLQGHTDAPLFLWVHYYEPHSRYTPPPQHALWGEAAPIDRYDGEIHYVDEQVGVLLDRLRGLGVLEGAYVVFAADHGEEFLEHGRTMHAYAVYEESVRVPWVVRGPDLPARRISAPVTLLDLTPTLLELLDIPGIPGAEGVSQAAALRGGAVAQRPFFIEQYRHGFDEIQKIAVVEENFKMILDLEHQLWELYDVIADPGERDNLDGREPARSLRLRSLLLEHRARAQALRWREAGR